VAAFAATIVCPSCRTGGICAVIRDGTANRPTSQERADVD
jgi:hypothetical protein